MPLGRVVQENGETDEPERPESPKPRRASWIPPLERSLKRSERAGVSP